MEDSADSKIRELWARQGISPADIDDERWARRRDEIVRMAAWSRSCIYLVDVYREVYDYISEQFIELFGVGSESVEALVHPDDRERLTELQIRHAKFIYSLPPPNATTTGRSIRCGCAAPAAGMSMW